VLHLLCVVQLHAEFLVLCLQVCDLLLRLRASAQHVCDVCSRRAGVVAAKSISKSSAVRFPEWPRPATRYGRFSDQARSRSGFSKTLNCSSLPPPRISAMISAFAVRIVCVSSGTDSMLAGMDCKVNVLSNARNGWQKSAYTCG